MPAPYSPVGKFVILSNQNVETIRLVDNTDLKSRRSLLKPLTAVYVTGSIMAVSGILQ